MANQRAATEKPPLRAVTLLSLLFALPICFSTSTKPTPGVPRVSPYLTRRPLSPDGTNLRLRALLHGKPARSNRKTTPPGGNPRVGVFGPRISFFDINQADSRRAASVAVSHASPSIARRDEFEAAGTLAWQTSAQQPKNHPSGR